MRYTEYRQGEQITLAGLKYHLRVVDNTHDAELEAMLKTATITAQEYINVCLVPCSVVREPSHADTSFMLFLDGRKNVRVTDRNDKNIAYEVVGDKVTISQAQHVKIYYDCEPSADADRYAILVYQIAAAYYDGQPEQIANILRNYPVML